MLKSEIIKQNDELNDHSVETPVKPRYTLIADYCLDESLVNCHPTRHVSSLWEPKQLEQQTTY